MATAMRMITLRAAILVNTPSARQIGAKKFRQHGHLGQEGGNAHFFP